jgi:CheY-like chemotaxis protein
MFEILISFFLGLSTGIFLTFFFLKKKFQTDQQEKSDLLSTSDNSEQVSEDIQTLGYETNLSWHTVQEPLDAKVVSPVLPVPESKPEADDHARENEQRHIAEFIGRDTVFYADEDGILDNGERQKKAAALEFKLFEVGISPPFKKGEATDYQEQGIAFPEGQDKADALQILPVEMRQELQSELPERESAPLHLEKIEGQIRLEQERVASDAHFHAQQLALEDAKTKEREKFELQALEFSRLEAERIIESTRQSDLKKASAAETIRLEIERAALAALDEAKDSEAKLAVEVAQRQIREQQERLLLEKLQQETLLKERLQLESLQQEQTLQRPALEIILPQETTVTPEQEEAIPVRAPLTKISKIPEETVIMVADDSKVARTKISRALNKLSYQISLAENGMDAVAKITASRPDVLITDVEMPGMDGFALTTHLRANPDTQHLPIIMISGSSLELTEKAKQAGVDVLLGKPYSDEELMSHIRRFMQA